MSNAEDKIEWVSLNEIKPHPKNPNVHSNDQIERLAALITYQGFRVPIIVDQDSGFIVAGHGRLLAAIKLGLEKVPIIKQKFKDEDQIFAFLVSDNAIGEWDPMDLALINMEVENLGPDFDIDMLGIKNFEIEPADKLKDGDEDAAPSVPVEPKTKLGDLYIMGNHRLLCGDSTNVQHVERLMNGDLADLVFTDPPYGVSYDGGHAEKGKRREKLANDDSTLIYNDSVPMMFHFSKPNAALYLWFAATKSLQVLQVLQDNNYDIRSWIIWNKNMAQFGAIGAQYKQKHEPCLYCFKKGNTPFWDGPNNEVSVWDEKRASKNEFHPTQKPVELSKRAIANSAPKKGIVLDLFGGSGSTLIGCEATNRNARAMELSPAYCDVICKRFFEYSGEEPVRINEDGSQTKWSEF